jgi:hypothetical protein
MSYQSLDTRDLYQRKCELEDARDSWETAKEEALEALTDAGLDPANREFSNRKEKELWEAYEESLEEPSDFGKDEQEELTELENLENEISGFMHGVQLIEESGFEDYARDLAEDIGAISRDMAWPCNCIDWNQAAKELESDYSSITYQGTDYLYRD